MAEVEIVMTGRDETGGMFANWGESLSNLGNIITGIKSGFEILAATFEAAADAIQPFIDSASEGEVALAGLDTVLRSTAPNAGLFQETIGRLSNTELTGLYDQLERARGRLAEMRDEFGNARTYTEQETIALAAQHETIARLTAQIERGTNGLTVFRDTTQLSRDALIELADSLQLTTQYSDEQVMAAEAMMLRFENVNQHIFPDAIRLSADLAQSLGIDLTTAARSIGMALDNPEQGIGRLNTQFRIFNDTQMDTIKNMAANGDIAGAQAIIMETLAQKVGGAAEAYGDTFAGSVAIARNRLDEMRETIGGPIMFGLGELLDKLVQFADTNPIIQSVLNFFDTLNTFLRDDFDAPFLLELGAALRTFDETVPVLGDIGQALVSFQNVLSGGGTVWEAFNAGLEELRAQWEGSPLEGIVTRVQEFIDTAESEGWGAAIRGVFDDIMNAIDIPGRIEYLTTAITNQLILIANDPALAAAISGMFQYVIEGALTGLSDIVSRIDWGPLGVALRDALWQMLTAAGSGIGNAFWSWFAETLFGEDIDSFFANTQIGAGRLGEILLGLAFPPSLIVTMRDEMREAAGDIIDGLWEGWENALDSIGAGGVADWWYDHIIAPVKRILGISSPSTVFRSIGRDIIQGLIDGLNSMLTTLQTAVNNVLSIINPFDNGGTSGGRLGENPDTRSGIITGTSPGGGLAGGTTLTGQPVTNNYYGPVYFMGAGEPGSYYDCPSPNPFLSATAGGI